MEIKQYLSQFKVDASKHSEVTNMLTNLIEKGILKPGEKLPTEEKLAKDLDVSKAITRKAYYNLMVKGLIQRLPKKGVVVSHTPTSHTFTSRLQSVGEDMLAMGLEPSVKLNSVLQINNQNLKLSVFNPNEALLFVSRVILANNLPLMVMESYYSLDRYPKLETLDLSTNSIFDYLKSDYQEEIKDIQRTLEPIKMSKEIALLLKVQVDSACTKGVSIAHNRNGECVEYGISYGIGDRFSITLK